MGRCLAPSPLLETAGLVGALIAELGDEDQKQAMLPAIAEGEAIYCLALMEPEGAFGPEGVTLCARRCGDDFVLNGVKVLVPYAATANRLVCVVRTDTADVEHGISLMIVDPAAKGVTLDLTPNIGGLPLHTVTFDDVTVQGGDVLGPVGDAWPALHRAINKAAVLQSVIVVGAGERLLEMSVDYAKTRQQFGHPIGKYQAVQYLATDIAIQLNLTRLLALQAAWRIDAGHPFGREAALAKAAASKAAAEMTFAAHELHAGIGFMVDYDLQLYTRRAKYWESYLGDARFHLECAMKAIEAGETPVQFEDILSAR
jgi:alkylation response protein AidB-like acyl-CoA dehydrogenase